jgi:MerR family mercuric resistance operon transcriptional regulator
MRIGEVAGRSRVSVETVRFYERQGLLSRPPRPASGFRDYPAAAVSRIVFIRRAQQLGFSLAEVKDLLQLRVRAGASCEAVRRRAEAKLADVQARIADLRRIQKSVARLVESCEQREPTGNCPILDALGD